jgi:hypothetical protein
VDEDGAVRLHDQEPGRLGEERGEPTGVEHFAAGDDEAHGPAPYRPFRTGPSDPAGATEAAPAGARFLRSTA